MVIFTYTHAFSVSQLQVILSQYLQLGPYFECLNQCLQLYMNTYLQLSLQSRHNVDKQHPIRLPINCYNLKEFKGDTIDSHTYKGDIEYIFPLTIILDVLKSYLFYQHLPKNILINGLLTTTNIQIIIKVLTMLSKDLSKSIKNTLVSIQDRCLTNYIHGMVNKCFIQDKVQQVQFHQSKRGISHKNLELIDKIFQSKKKKLQESKNFKIQTAKSLQTDDKKGNQIFVNKQKHKRSSIIASILNDSNSNKQDTKNVVKTIKNLLNSSNFIKHTTSLELDNEDECQNKINQVKQTEFIQCVYCNNYRNYLLESTGLTFFDIQQISHMSNDTFNLLRKTKRIIHAFTLYLNQTNQTTIPVSINIVNKILASINLVITQQIWQNSSLNPKLNGKMQNKLKKSQSQSKVNKKCQKNSLISELQPFYGNVYNYQGHTQRQFTINELLDMCLKAPQQKVIQKSLAQKYMSQTRTNKQDKDIQSYCIRKQNLNNRIKIQINSFEPEVEQAFNDSQKNFILQKKGQYNEIQLLREYQKQQRIVNRAKMNCRPMYSQINQKYQQQIKGKNLRKSTKQIQSLQQHQKYQQQLQTTKFKSIIQNQYLRNQGLPIKSLRSQILQDQIRCQSLEGSLRTERQINNQYDKKEMEIYNKMLLNGYAIRNQIHAEIGFQDAKIYQHYQQCINLFDSTRTNNINNQINQQSQTPNQMFLTSTNTQFGVSRKNNKSKTYKSMKKQSIQCTNKDLLKKPRNGLLINQNTQSQSNTKNNKWQSTPTQSIYDYKADKRKLFKKINQMEDQQKQNVDIQIRKPDWIHQFLDKNHNPQKIMSYNHNQKLFHNKKFQIYQQKIQIRKVVKMKSQKKFQVYRTSQSQKYAPFDIPAPVQQARPFSAISRSSKGTISKSRPISGKSRTYNLLKDIQITNNYLLTKMFQQNLDKDNIKAKIQKENQLSIKLNKCRF